MEDKVRAIKNWLQLNFLSDRVNSQLQKLLLDKLSKIFDREWDFSVESACKLKALLPPKALRSAGKAVVERIESGQVLNWDMTVVSFVLRSLGGQSVSKDERQQVEAAVRVRNYIAHHPDKIVPHEEFTEKWTTLLEVLAFFNVPTEAIENEITARTADIASLYSPVVKNQEANKLKDEGNGAFRDADHEKALQKYEEAMRVVSLTDAERGVLFSNRSSAFLQLAKAATDDGKRKDNAQRAANDAKRAVHLQPLWTKAYVRLAQAYEVLDKYQKAIAAYDEALSLNPSMDSVRASRDDCRSKLGQRQRADHMNVCVGQLWSSEGLVEEEQRSLGHKFIKKEGIDKIMTFLRERNDSRADVYDGIKHRDGQGTPVNYELAAKYFSKAAGKGDAHGTFELAVLTKDGRGVKKDLLLAVQLFRRASEMSPNLADGNENDGVRESMHWLGLMYDEGVGVPKSEAMAFQWYQRAADLEHGPSACNLGHMYSQGRGGIPCANLVRAVQYWQLAVRRNCVPAMLALSGHYLQQGDVEAARRYAKWAADAGDLQAKVKLPEFEELCRQVEEKMLFCKSELENKLGVSFEEGELVPDAVKAYIAQSAPDVAQAMKKVDLAHRSAATGLSPASRVGLLGYKYDPVVIAKYAADGRPYAQRVFKALEHFANALSCLMAYRTKCRDVDRDAYVKELGQCLELAPFVVAHRPEDREFVLEFLRDMLDRYKDESCQLDIYVRECYSIFLAESFEENAAFLRRCITKYPQVPYFHECLVSMHGFLKQYQAGLAVAERALTLFPDNCDLLFCKAGMSRLALTDIPPRRLIPNHLKFVQTAPIDHRLVPGELYYMAMLVLEEQYSEAHFNEALVCCLQFDCIFIVT